jgi:hypothetical protein
LDLSGGYGEVVETVFKRPTTFSCCGVTGEATKVGTGLESTLPGEYSAVDETVLVPFPTASCCDGAEEETDVGTDLVVAFSDGHGMVFRILFITSKKSSCCPCGVVLGDDFAISPVRTSSLSAWTDVAAKFVAGRFSPFSTPDELCVGVMVSDKLDVDDTFEKELNVVTSLETSLAWELTSAGIEDEAGCESVEFETSVDEELKFPEVLDDPGLKLAVCVVLLNRLSNGLEVENTGLLLRALFAEVLLCEKNVKVFVLDGTGILKVVFR